MESCIEAEYLSRISEQLTEPVDSYKVVREGWTNLVIEINNRWIFRFVRNKNNRQIVVEREFLPKFVKVCPVSIPEIVFSESDYIAYPKILGERFSPEKFALFSNFQKAKIFELLGKFLACLHSFSFSHQYLSDAPYDGKDFWNELWSVVQHRLSPYTKEKAKKYFTDVLKQIEATAFESTLIHADLGTNNILVDFQQNELTGIIDFGDLCLGDPAVDFAGFYRNFGRQFTQELLNNYQRPIENNFWTRIEYQSKRKLLFVVYFALNNGFEKDIPNILQYIETLF